MTRQRLSRSRLLTSLVLVIALFCVFGVRLFWIQGLDAQAYAALARKSATSTVTVPAPRGDILDRNGEVMATNVDSLTLTADPKNTAKKAPQIARILVTTLGADRVDYFELIEKLRTPKSRYVVLEKNVPAAAGQKAITAIRKAGAAGVFAEKTTMRTYPGGRLAANLLGYLGQTKDSDTLVGVQGLERQYNRLLTGKDGSATYEVSPTGQRIPMADSTVVEMKPGRDVRTTIDRDLQWYSDQRLADAVRSSGSDWGLAITMDVRTGQVVQLSQAPTFDPETRAGMQDANTVSRFVQTVYEPGSVLKTVTMAALADQGKISPDTHISVPGKMIIDKFPIGDYWEHGTINLTAAGVIAKSSNLGTIVAAQQMNNATMHDYLHKFGFGVGSGVQLPGESDGILTPASSWTKANKATIAFGQGISVTALQVVRAVGAIANGGVLVDPSVVNGFVDADGHQEPAKEPTSRRVVSKKAAAEVTRMMEAVTADDGTAPAAQIPGYRVAGKTGTAWRVNPVTGRYVRGQNTVSFIGFAPADAPRFITYVVLDKPYAAAGGGSTAAPIFHDIMSMALERFGVTPTGSKSPKVAQTW